MPLLTAATTEETGAPADEEGSDPVELLRTGALLLRLWFPALFAAAVFAATVSGWMSAAPGGYIYFWGALTAVAGYYALRKTPDVLGDR